MRKNDMILIVALVVLALLCIPAMSLVQGMQTKNGVAVVTIDDVEYGRYPLTEDMTERIALPDGAYNLLVIQDGKADVTEASCPDGNCVRHRAVSKKGQSIVCLPNKLVVEIENGEEAEFDAVTN